MQNSSLGKTKEIQTQMSILNMPLGSYANLHCVGAAKIYSNSACNFGTMHLLASNLSANLTLTPGMVYTENKQNLKFFSYVWKCILYRI